MESHRNHPIKILYISPFAHYQGHYSYLAGVETNLLLEGGAQVNLLTFEGLLDTKEHPKITSYSVVSKNKNYVFLGFLRKRTFTKWVCMFVEYSLTLTKALRLKKSLGYQMIYLRDAEPFIFLFAFFSLFTKNICWSVCLISDPNSKFSQQKSLLFSLLGKCINAKLWYFLYAFSFSRNKFIFTTENEYIKNAYQIYQKGIFSGKICCIPLPSYNMPTDIISKKEARRHLGLPKDAPLFLSFGTIHSGKDFKTILGAFAKLPEAVLVHAGKTASFNGVDINQVQLDYPKKIIVNNSYISETEKCYYFFAADAVVLSYMKHFNQNPGILWEAARFGIPVIASNSGEIGQIVKKFNTGLVFEAENVSSLIESIKNFSKLHFDTINEFKKNCDVFNSFYSTQRWTGNLFNIYEKVLS